jgi:hypothetical protein
MIDLRGLLEAVRSIQLFAEEVLPTLHRMEAPLHDAALPEKAQPQ